MNTVFYIFSRSTRRAKEWLFDGFKIGNMINYRSVNGFKSVYLNLINSWNIQNVFKEHHNNYKIQICFIRNKNFSIYCVVGESNQAIPNSTKNCAEKDLHSSRRCRYFIGRLQFGSYFETIFYVSIDRKQFLRRRSNRFAFYWFFIIIFACFLR